MVVKPTAKSPGSKVGPEPPTGLPLSILSIYHNRVTLYNLLKSRLIGCMADSVPCVVYIGPAIVGGGTILYTPALVLEPSNPSLLSSRKTFFIVQD